MNRRIRRSGQGTPPISSEPYAFATVARSVSAGEELHVLLEDLPDQPVGPVRGWAERATPVTRGDGCLVVQAAGDWWFVTWDIAGWA